MGRAIPGVFHDFLFQDAIDGSLWTLPVEFVSYIILGVALSYSNTWKPIAGLLILAIVTVFLIKTNRIIDFSFYVVPISYLAIFGIAFTTGALMSTNIESWFSLRPQMIVISFILLFLLRGHYEVNIIGTMCLAVITIVIGVSFRDRLINRKFDISYGIYIYAFPIQQIVINRVTQNFWLSMFISLILTLIAGYLSHRFVEKPFSYAASQRRKRSLHINKNELNPISG